MAALKAKVAVAALKEDNTSAKLAEKYDLNANQIAQWRTQLIETGTGLVLTPVEKGPGPSAWPSRSLASTKRAQRNDRRYPRPLD